VKFVAFQLATNSLARFGVRQLAAAFVRLEMFHRP